MRTIRTRHGFALPMTIMVIVVLTAALTAAFVATASETTTNVAVRGQSRAYMIAQMGLERFLENPDELAVCPKCDTLRTTPVVQTFGKAIDGDSAYITVTRIRHQSRATIPAVYFIQSRGIDKRSKMSGKLSKVDAERSVGMYAQWNAHTMQVLSAWTSLTGLKKTGTAGMLSGVDQCGEEGSIAGTTVGQGDLFYNGHPNWAEGNPAIDTTMTPEQLADSVGKKINWNAIKSGNAIPADFTVPPDAFPTAGWFESDTARWPVIHITADNYALPNRGRGILIIDGNFTISGENMWDGVILVGGKMTSNGSNTVAGAVISGLNVLIPEENDKSTSEFDDALAAGQKTYIYSSCKVARATKFLQRYRVLANTWADNLPTW
ncbi:MAG: hypothetical protein ABR499_12290 [Gemmatimonadaceae bacterium]